MTKNKCHFLNCGNTSKECRVFRFPVKYPCRVAIWLKNCGNPELMNLGNKELKNKFLCSAHFDEKFLKPKEKRQRLAWNAIPYSYLEKPGVPRVLCPTTCKACGGNPTCIIDESYLGQQDGVASANNIDNEDIAHAESPDEVVFMQHDVIKQDEDGNKDYVVYLPEDTENVPTDVAIKAEIEDDVLKINETTNVHTQDNATFVDTVQHNNLTHNPNRTDSTNTPRTYRPKFVAKKRPINYGTPTITLAKIDKTTQTGLQCSITHPPQPPKRCPLYEQLEADYRTIVKKHGNLQRLLKLQTRRMKRSRENVFGKLTSHLNPIAQKFFHTQLCWKRLPVFSLDIKILALTIYKLSGPCYRLLRKIFYLPSKSTLQILAKTIDDENKQDQCEDTDQILNDKDDLDESNDIQDIPNQSPKLVEELNNAEGQTDQSKVLQDDFDQSNVLNQSCTPHEAVLTVNPGENGRLKKQERRSLRKRNIEQDLKDNLEDSDCELEIPLASLSASMRDKSERKSKVKMKPIPSKPEKLTQSNGSPEQAMKQSDDDAKSKPEYSEYFKRRKI